MPPRTADCFLLAAALALVGPPVLWSLTRYSIFYVRFPWAPFGRRLPSWPIATRGWACVACGLEAIAFLLQGLRRAVEAPRACDGSHDLGRGHEYQPRRDDFDPSRSFRPEALLDKRWAVNIAASAGAATTMEAKLLDAFTVVNTEAALAG